MSNLTLKSLGGAGTVTGSKHLLESGGRRVLVDCGLFQGLKDLRQKNWAPFPVDPATIDAVVLTHAHLDHCGYLPRLVRDGFRGDILCSAGTADLAEIIMLDSAKIQESDAEYANRHGFSRHKPALPLYGKHDAERAVEQLRPVDYETPIDLRHGVELRLRQAGHILGASTAEIRWGGRTVVFSGDLGRYGDPITPDPAAVAEADYLLVESTYGDRLHDRVDAGQALLDVIERTARRGGTVIIPAFAVGRAQELLYHLAQLKRNGHLGLVPVYLDSPMAIDASGIMCRHLGDHRLTPDQCREACEVATYTRDVEESKQLSANAMPKVIISASGMATGGRVLHHLKAYAPDPRNTVLLAGYQAAGTRGEALTSGARELKIHGQWVPVRAEVANLPMLSAHADADEILRWLGGFARPPRRTFIVHGEAHASAALKARIEDELGWACAVPAQDEAHVLS
jgi:metallo-beta-lactamase family protein